MNILRTLALPTILAIAAGLSSVSHADSSFVTGAGALNANASLDFRIVIPKFIRFEVGTATPGTVDLVEFDLTASAANVGDGSDIARTNGGVVPVRIQSNGGNISLIGTTTGALSDGIESISFDEILSSSSNAQLNAPTLVDGAASATVTVTPNVGTRVVNRTADWTFAYSNTNFVAAGTYGGVNVNNGRVVYTASLP